jgi:hypothetical protein
MLGRQRQRALFFPLDDQRLARVLVSSDPVSQRLTFLLQFIASPIP